MPLTTIVEVVTAASVSAVGVAFWNVCGVPVQATGTVVEVEVDDDVLVVDDDVELEVDELVLVLELVDDDVLELIDDEELVLLDDDVLVLDDVLVVVGLLVEVDVDDDVEVVELDVLVVVLVDVDVVVVRSHPMSVMRSRASDGRSCRWCTTAPSARSARAPCPSATPTIPTRVSWVRTSDVSARVASGAEDAPRRDRRAARPVEIRVVDRRRGPLRVGHVRPGEPEAVVFEELHEGVVFVVEAHAGGRRHVRLEAEAVADLVQHDRDEVELAPPRVAVETVVPGVRNAQVVPIALLNCATMSSRPTRSVPAILFASACG
jgi:hypothetical protein